MNNFNKTLTDILKKDLRFLDQDGDLLKSEVIDKAWKVDKELIELLLSEKQVKDKFFTEIKKHWVFNVAFFVEFVQDKNFLNDSYTKFKNKIGLTVDGKYLNQRGEVALAWPYKDCVLEGGQSNEDTGRDEIFFNEILAQDEIDRLLDPKVFTNWKRFSEKGEEKVKEIKRDENGVIKENLIIKGNNLLALHSLKKQFSGKVKLIYIDPPYNTGNDGFRYNDRFNHSTWLTFMKNRLEVARALLREDGVIFVQCDDNEQAYLKVLMDGIFGMDNFLNTVSVMMKNTSGASGGGEDARLKKNIEFLTIFSKNDEFFKKFNPVNQATELYETITINREKGVSWKYTSILVEKGDKKLVGETVDGSGNKIKIYNRNNPVFKPINQIAKEENLSEKEVYYKYIKSIFRTTMPQSSIRPRVMKKCKELNVKCDFISIEYIPISGRNKGKVYEQFYKGDKFNLLAWLSDVVEINNEDIFKTETLGTFWNVVGSTKNLTKEGEVSLLSGKKPEDLIKTIVQLGTNENDIVLDYHLGSGTTCAVAHKMNRQYIGIEQMSYIEDLAVKRLQNVVNGDQSGISKSVEWKGGGDFIYLELKKYNEAFIDRIQNAKNTNELEKIWVEMKEKSFLNWNIDFRNADLAFEEWVKLDLEKKQHALVQLLNKNQLYVNMSEVEDKEFGCTEEEKRLSGKFYNL
ncbi:MAG: site-specific DNA-methyltransferase [Melioribacteraceae bacterium]|nr:site-specific DNA-methyltransferase [Saprospiraceae bacterium]MCF8396047.1 site-specific DNA-methyltransferase [Melioribacteraceae bacterium]